MTSHFDRPFETDRYVTRGGITVHRQVEEVDGAEAVASLIDRLDRRRGLIFASSYEYPGRYTRWDLGFSDPPLALVTRGRDVRISALNDRGRVLLPPLVPAFEGLPALSSLQTTSSEVRGTIREPEGRFPEEERSRQPSVFSLLRALVELFFAPEDSHLGLYGAFGYDLAFQFEPIRLRLERPANQRDLVLYLPDELIVVDHRKERATRRRYDFEVGGRSTRELSRVGTESDYVGTTRVERTADRAPGEYAESVRQAREAFRRGDLFEVVLSQTLFEPCPAAPSEVFRRLRERNPAPYGFLINLGEDEYLIGASPEMYVRVEGDRVETCPISGTIARGRDPLDDAEQIRALLNSAKDESELTMCTDVDRNDKSRICRPGSVQVIGRRQIEIYSRLIHTADHVVGTLEEGFDALDAFLVHAWAVTVTGAPKTWAIRFIEDHETSARAWYGGAIGLIGFDGNLNTGLTLRTIRVKDGVAEVRVGATLLFDSDPDAEEAETHVKASAFVDAIRRPEGRAEAADWTVPRVGEGRRILLVDHQDSFVHTLANYLRQTGAEVATLRSTFAPEELRRRSTDLVVLSPGPGTPRDFDVSATVGAALERGVPLFGVCLGLQGIVEYFGGELGVFRSPVHGKPSTVRVLGGALFEGLPRTFRAGRYHSLFAVQEKVPAVLHVTAQAEDEVVMAVEHEELPVAAVQFHPESILTGQNLGLRLLANAVAVLCA